MKSRRGRKRRSNRDISHLLVHSLTGLQQPGLGQTKPGEAQGSGRVSHRSAEGQALLVLLFQAISRVLTEKCNDGTGIAVLSGCWSCKWQTDPLCPTADALCLLLLLLFIYFHMQERERERKTFHLWFTPKVS